MRIVLALLMLTAPALATPTIVVDADGNYFLDRDGDGGDMEPLGVPVIYRLPGAPGPPQPPIPPEPPEPPPESGLRADVKEWAEDVDEPGDAFLLAGVYGLLAEKIEDGSIKSTPDAVNKAMNSMLALTFDRTQVDEDDWWDFDVNVTTALGDMVGTDFEADTEEWVEFFETVESGLRDSFADQGIIDDLLQQLLNLLLQWLLELLGDLF